jgi:biotin operon repressor
MPSELQLNDVLELTAPNGISVKNWRGMLDQAWQCREIWSDKWVRGSEGWEEIFGPENAPTPAPASSTVPTGLDQVVVVAEPVDRAEFRRMARRHLKPKSNGISPLTLALELSNFGKDDGTKVFVSAVVLARKVGASRSRVDDARRNLRRAGWLIEDGHQGRAVMYHLAVPQHLRWSEASTAAA